MPKEAPKIAASQIIHSVGRKYILDILNAAVSRDTAFFIGLRQLDGAGGHPADAAAADTMTSNLQEVSGSGYSRQTATYNTTNAPNTASGADWITTFALQTFSFSGTVTGITHAFWSNATGTGGVLIGSAPLSVTRNVANGDQLKVTLVFTMTQG